MPEIEGDGMHAHLARVERHSDRVAAEISDERVRVRLAVPLVGGREGEQHALFAPRERLDHKPAGSGHTGGERQQQAHGTNDRELYGSARQHRLSRVGACSNGSGGANLYRSGVK